MGAHLYHNELYHNEFTTTPTVNAFIDSDISRLRGGKLHCLSDKFWIGNWNVQGLTDLKLVELQAFMVAMQISVLSMTEVHVAGAESYVSNAVFFVALSGGVIGQREYGGVGILVAPWARKYAIGFSEFSDRIMSMKLRIKGGQLGIICA